jgi:hypothetical protein
LLLSDWLEEVAFEVVEPWNSGWDFTVVFDDALVGGLDEELDELNANLAAAEGVTEVLHEDREVFHLRVEGLEVSDVEERVGEAVERTGISYDR